MLSESDIVHETANLYCVQMQDGRYQIRLNGIRSCCALIVGYKPDIQAAVKFMERAERYPHQMR